MKVKELKEIIMNLNDDYEVRMQDQEDDAETIHINSVEVDVKNKEIVFKTW